MDAKLCVFRSRSLLDVNISHGRGFMSGNPHSLVTFFEEALYALCLTFVTLTDHPHFAALNSRLILTNREIS